MNDQERITDLILLEKKMSTNYNEFASECASPQLRSKFLDLLNLDQSIRSELVQTAQQKGWYQMKAADAAEINQAYQKFSAMQ